MNTLRLTLALALVSSVALLGCDPEPNPGTDAGMRMDTGVPPGSDAGPDTGMMTMTDSGPDTGMMMMGACTPAGGNCDFIDQDCPAGEGCIGRIRDMPSACVSAARRMIWSPSRRLLTTLISARRWSWFETA